jgi:hypothetical protein
MTSTVTVSTASTILTAALANPVALIGILVLLFLLVQKELASSSDNSRLRMLSRALNIGIIPLLIAFVLIVAVRVVDVLH